MRINQRIAFYALVGVVTALTAQAAVASGITGAGSTFAYPIFAQWADAYYKSESGVAVNYQSIGSGGGIKQIKAGTVTFGATDEPLAPAALKNNGLVQWPQIIGGVIPVVNLPGIKPGALRIDGPTLARIYLGDITRWNDSALQKLNPKVKLPSLPIIVVYRADGSGTTFNFSHYLSAVSPKWKGEVGTGTALEWPVGIGAKGNEAVANQTAQTRGAIGYVEYAFVVQNHMTYLKMINLAGYTVSPGIASFQSAAAHADWQNAPGYSLTISNQPGEDSWPIAATTFVLAHQQADDAANVHQALAFFDWSFKHGQKMAEALGYVPMPASVVALIETTWVEQIKDKTGAAIWK